MGANIVIFSNCSMNCSLVLTDSTSRSRWEHEHRSAASHFLKLVSEEKRQLSEQAVIPERNPTTLDRPTPADQPTQYKRAPLLE
jgi:hypothetical protein